MLSALLSFTQGTAKLLTLSLALLCFTQPSFADEVFSWKQCVDLATANNNNLKAAIENEKSTAYQRNATISGFLPHATANLGSDRNATTRSNIISQTYTNSVSVTQNIFSGLQDVGKFDQAKANNMVSKANILLIKAQVSYDLKFSYQNLTYAKETVNLLDNIIRRRQDNLHIIELRFKSGMENKGSLLLARAYLEQAKYDRLQGSNLIESARAQLCKAMGLSDCQPFDIQGTVPITTPSEKVDFGLITETTPQHLQATAQEQAAKAGIIIAESTFMPSIDLTAAAGQRDTNIAQNSGYWTVGLNLSLPFFTGGKDYYTTQSAYSIKAAAKENRQTVDQQILVSLKQTRNAYIEAIAKLKVDQSFQEAVRMRADIARSKYNNGLLSFEDWDVIETDLINRQKFYLQSKLNRVVNEAAWEQAQGKGVFSHD